MNARQEVYEMPIIEKGIRYVIKEEFQTNNDAMNMSLIDAETGIRYEHFDFLNDEMGEA